MRLRTEGLVKRFGKTTALGGVDLDFAGGRVVAVVGANGGGKPTLLGCLAAILAPDRGRILFDGEELRLPIGSGVDAVPLGELPPAWT